MTMLLTSAVLLLSVSMASALRSKYCADPTSARCEMYQKMLPKLTKQLQPIIEQMLPRSTIQAVGMENLIELRAKYLMRPQRYHEMLKDESGEEPPEHPMLSEAHRLMAHYRFHRGFRYHPPTQSNDNQERVEIIVERGEDPALAARELLRKLEIHGSQTKEYPDPDKPHKSMRITEAVADGWRYVAAFMCNFKASGTTINAVIISAAPYPKINRRLIFVFKEKELEAEMEMDDDIWKLRRHDL